MKASSLPERSAAFWAFCVMRSRIGFAVRDDTPFYWPI
ncbi:hypothetical protein PbB2_01101 [Candidatus Phycosocius bacilliformis]|uniref:Uncharacterized protein n=1 Tax=Candidatus Phycosocius bacilliformis TaxID=1445552 RepID=A0A2P2E8T1_9PROT|nr:hypothetical protein PbB2_01101 [Candidatus Phycosocius bacilliformis]